MSKVAFTPGKLGKVKRGKKETESPSLAQQREVKRGKRDDEDQVEGAESSPSLETQNTTKEKPGVCLNLSKRKVK